MINHQIEFEEQISNSSTLQSKEVIFRIKKLRRKGLLEKKSMQLNNTFIAGKWTQKENEAFIHSCFIHGPRWKQIKLDIKTRTIGQIRSHAHKYMIRLCRKYGIQVVNKKHKRFNKKNTDHLIQKKHASKWKSISGITKEEIKFLKEFNFYIKKYDERLYSLIYAVEIKFEQQKEELSKRAKAMQNYIENSLNEIVETNNLSFLQLFCTGNDK